jgi:hypothetical protein
MPKLCLRSCWLWPDTPVHSNDLFRLSFFLGGECLDVVIVFVQQDVYLHLG